MSSPGQTCAYSTGGAEVSSVRAKDSLAYLGNPWTHQLDALQFSTGKRDVALFFEVGTGKTYTAILIARDKMLREGRAMRVLVMCPPVVIGGWKKEWLSRSKVSEGDIACLMGPMGKRAEKIRSENPLVVVTNYEALLSEPVVSALREWRPEIIIWDESHRCKSHDAKRTKVAVKISALAKHRMILTGTPILNSPMDAFSQFQLLDCGETFGDNFYSFRAKYFYDRNAGMPPQKHFPDWKVREKLMTEMKSLIARSAVYAKKSECLDLPPYVREVVEIELTPKQRKAYTDLANDFIHHVEDKVCTAPMALTKGLRLMQVVSGFMMLEGESGDENTVSDFADDPRKDALRQLLEDYAESSKVVVWAVFRQNYKAIRDVCRSLGLKFVELHGDIPTAEKTKNVESFNTDESVRICIGHPQSGGIGVSLIAGSVSIFYSRSFSLADDIQAEARIYRGGSEIHEKVTRIDLVAKDSIDELVASRLAAKQEISDDVLRTIAEEMKCRQSKSSTRRSKSSKPSRPITSPSLRP